jgi:hypothetical protein
MVSQQATTEASLAEEIGKLGLGSRRNMGPEDFPPLLTVTKGVFEDLK